MTTELRAHNQSQQLYVRALASAWRSGVQIHDPSIWLLRDPEVEEKMLRDADIVHAIGQRTAAVAGLQWSIKPGRPNSPRAPVAIAVARALLEKIRHFTESRRLLARAFLHGARYGRIHWRSADLEIGDGRTRTWMVPIRIEDVDKRMFRIVPKNDGKTIRAHWERWNLATQEWEPETMADAMSTIRHTFQDDQASLGHGRGLREALGWWWYAKEHVFAESLQAVERFAQGILSMKIEGARDAATGQPNTELIRACTAVLEDMRSRHVLVYDAADTVEIIHPGGEGWQLLKDIRAELKQTIVELILGATLPTSANEGGSYALGKVQESSSDMLMQFDREALQETLTEKLIGACWAMNHRNILELGIDVERPLFVLNQEKTDDPAKRADVASKLNGMGINLSLADVLDQTGFRKPEPGEETVAGRQAPAFDPFGLSSAGQQPLATPQRAPVGQGDG